MVELFEADKGNVGQDNLDKVSEFIDPDYQFSFRLPYCQWDLRDVSTIRASGGLDPQYKATIDGLKKYMQMRGRESFGFGLLITSSQAEMCGFRPGVNWREGDILLGGTTQHCYYNPEPIICVISEFEKIYRLRETNERGQEIVGSRYFPQPGETVDMSRCISYYRYLVALVDRREDGSFELLHENPITFAPRRRSGILFRSEVYEAAKTAFASYYGNQVAPFVFGLQLRQQLDSWSQSSDPSKRTDVVRMVYSIPRSRDELRQAFVGVGIGQTLKRWFKLYASSRSQPNLEKSGAEADISDSNEVLF